MSALLMARACWLAVVGRHVRSERGASIVEYALLVSLIAVLCLGALTLIGGSTDASLSETAKKLP